MKQTSVAILMSLNAILLIANCGCGNIENSQESTTKNDSTSAEKGNTNEKPKSKSITGIWVTNYDVSNAEAEVLGFVASTKAQYDFGNNNEGERKVTAMGMEANSPLTWKIQSDTVYVEYSLFKELNKEKFVVENDKLRLLKTNAGVVTYLIRKN
jgi:hypothetical protein